MEEPEFINGVACMHFLLRAKLKRLLRLPNGQNGRKKEVLATANLPFKQARKEGTNNRQTETF